MFFSFCIIKGKTTESGLFQQRSYVSTIAACDQSCSKYSRISGLFQQRCYVSIFAACDPSTPNTLTRISSKNPLITIPKIF